MIVHLHASCWNEERMLPFFFRYYDSIVDHYYIHDNQSSDRSLEILSEHPRVTIFPLVLEGDSVCQAAFEQVNSFWHCSRGKADWVAVCNVDEFFWHPAGLHWYLRACKKEGITYLPSKGYEMVSDTFPAPSDLLTRTIRFGARNTVYDKPSFFNPDEITHSGFEMARHGASPEGNVVEPEKSEVLMLHYKHLGLEYLTARHAELNARLREKDRERTLGYHYDPEITLKRFEEFRTNAEEVVPETSSNLIRLKRTVVGPRVQPRRAA